jgi:hypothetical protein
MRGGVVPEREVADAVEGSLDAITRCAHTDDEFSSFVVQLLVGHDGAVLTASAGGTGPFGACVGGVVRGWRFSRSRGSYVAAVSVPISFGR